MIYLIEGRDAKGFEDYLFVHSDGRVFSKDRYIKNHSKTVLLKGKERNPSIDPYVIWLTT